ncbi:cytochrome aa3 quinol oxidase subunit II [Sporolactobacillus sp. THM7-7]|nr:cytochrome aa3 quinol oxidase subunit II [Sporolactobacillus sp. THM7-7]
MKKSFKIKLLGALALLLFALTGCSNVAVLNPQGPVARDQYHLIVWSLIMMSLILAVVLIIFIYVLVRFGRKNSKAHDPNDTGNLKLEMVWILIPVLICIALAVPTIKVLWGLENPPEAAAKAPDSLSGKTLTIDVTSVQWKWLFRYPEQNIETVNYVVIPEGVPVKFRLHAYDAMNAFWVPELGGQQYTMTDMPMQLWLQADKAGRYEGRSSNFSGRGFAHMNFQVLAKNSGDFDHWVSNIKENKPTLTMDKYKELLKPSTVEPTEFSSYPKEIEKNLNKAQMEQQEKGEPVEQRHWMDNHHHGDKEENHEEMDHGDMDMSGHENGHDGEEGGHDQ